MPAEGVTIGFGGIHYEMFKAHAEILLSDALCIPLKADFRFEVLPHDTWHPPMFR